MSEWLISILSWVIAGLSIAMILAFYRLLRGPGLPDRVVAFDLMAVIGVAMTALLAITTDEPAFLDIATVLALITFVGTVAFARYLERTTGR